MNVIVIKYVINDLAKKKDVEQSRKNLQRKSKLDKLFVINHKRVRFEPKKRKTTKTTDVLTNRKIQQTTNFSLVYMYTA